MNQGDQELVSALFKLGTFPIKAIGAGIVAAVNHNDKDKVHACGEYINRELDNLLSSGGSAKSSVDAEYEKFYDRAKNMSQGELQRNMKRALDSGRMTEYRAYKDAYNEMR